MPPSGDSRLRRIPHSYQARPSHSIYPTLAMCSTASTLSAGSPKASTLVRREIQRRDPQLRPPTFEPDLLASPLHPPTPSRPPQPSPPSTSQQDLRRSSPSPNRVRMLFKSSTNSTKPTTRTGPTRRSDGSPTSTPPAKHREYHQAVDTIIAWGEQILAYHTTRRVSNGPIEGTNNLHPSPTTRRPRVHQPQQLPSPPNPRNMTPTPTTAAPEPMMLLNRTGFPGDSISWEIMESWED